MTLKPLERNVLATENTTVFIPGAGPPPQRMMIESFISDWFMFDLFVLIRCLQI